jgi:hypothetical protein
MIFIDSDDFLNSRVLVFVDPIVGQVLFHDPAPEPLMLNSLFARLFTA